MALCDLRCAVMVPILGGPLRGKRWPAISRHTFLTGSYESRQLRLFSDALGQGDVVFDVGAHWGYFTLTASDRVGPTGKVVAFEPCAGNAAILRRTLQANRCTNVQVMELAITDEERTVMLQTRTRSRAVYVAEDGTVSVQSASLDHLIATAQVPPPRVMKVDVEGAEVRLLRGASALMREVRPVIFLATHPRFHTKEDCLAILSCVGYDSTPLDAEATENARHFIATPVR